MLTGNKVIQGMVLCAAAALAAGGAAEAAAGSPAPPPQPEAAVVRVVGAAELRSTSTFWTPARMESATPEFARRVSSLGAPRGTSGATKFGGVPTVGALFYTTGGKAHFCTASAVASSTYNLVLTAAHCVYSSNGRYNTKIEYVPEYNNGQKPKPYGGWPVKTITIAPTWTHWRDRYHDDYDFAFLSVVPPTGTTQPVQKVTGALSLGVNQGFAHPIEVIGYNDSDNEPLKCATNSVKFSANRMDFMKFSCDGYWTGTSGGPWILGSKASNGIGTVFGDIGGYEQGGNTRQVSYSSYYDASRVTPVFKTAENAARTPTGTTVPQHPVPLPHLVSPGAARG
jgi:V8-like Glu-specific endopeptidase